MLLLIMRVMLLRADTVDLSSREGSLKHLNSQLTDNGAAFFKLRELCVVVKVTHGIHVFK